ncbi:hypothetical protein GCM10022291_06300 [Postechiella marina]|uniref:Uncharacterized protein n=2 Tax=Postechiella marina TaxID=943941 RepID=A0ABP8C1X1_9FLAO
MKITGLHELSHCDDDNDHDTCAICDHAVVNQLTPTISPEVADFKIENISFPLKKEIAYNYNYTLPNTIIAGALCSRPPPFAL